MDINDDLLVAYTINGRANGDEWENILVAYNGHRSSQQLQLPEGTWTVVLNGKTIKEAGIGQAKDKIRLPGSSAVILVK